MSHIYIKQPNKKYAVYSTVVDNFIELNLSWKELGTFHTNQDGVALSQCVSEDKKNYEWEQLLKFVEDIHGKKKAKQISGKAS